jgi:exonuclease III
MEDKYIMRLTCWNVNVFKRSENYSKFQDEVFCKKLASHDIIGLTETHCGPEDVLSLPGYKTLSTSRAKANNVYKHSGGIAVLVKNDIYEGVDLHVKKGDHALWLKLQKKIFQHTL